MSTTSGRPTVSRAKARWGRGLAYLLVGAASLAVDLGVLLLVREGFGSPVWVAGTAGYWSSVVVNYVLNRRVAFADRSPARSSVMRYGALLAVNWACTVAILALAEATGVGYAAGKAAAVLLLTGLNFWAYSRWVFVNR